MRKITFSKPYVQPSDLDGVIIFYPYHIEIDTQEGKKVGESHVKIVTSGSLLIDYGYNIWVDDDPNYYGNFIKEMFPYVIDCVEAVTNIESRDMFFTTESRPGLPKSEWDGSKEIAGYELEV